MEKITKEKITAIQFVSACGGDIWQALDRLEMLRDSLFISGQLGKAEYVEKLIFIIRKK